MQRLLLALALNVIAAACGTGPRPADLGLRNRSVLTAEEMELDKGGARSAYDIIERLRPEYLRSRGTSSLRTNKPSTAVVYVDEMRFGELASLKSINVALIYRVEYINAADATTRFGTNHLGGAILITTR